MTTTSTIPDQGLKACLGIDVSKATLDACLLQDSADRQRCRRRFANSLSGLQELLQWLEKLHPQPTEAVMESTGSYGELAAHLLHEAGHRVSVVSPLRIQRYAQSRCRHNKTDQVDAEVIARFGFTQEQNKKLPQWLPTPEPQAMLRELLRRREDVACQLQAERNRLEAAAAKSAVLQSLRRSLCWIEEEMTRLEEEIAQLLASQPDLAEDCKRLEAIPGIGPKSARWLVAELPRTLQSSRAAAAWAGVAPGLFESGTIRKPSRISPAGNRYLRKTLFLGAVAARHHDPRFKTFADRLAARGLSKMAVVCAVLHKLLRTAFAILKNKSTYEPSHCSVLPKTTQNPA